MWKMLKDDYKKERSIFQFMRTSNDIKLCAINDLWSYLDDDEKLGLFILFFDSFRYVWTCIRYQFKEAKPADFSNSGAFDFMDDDF